MQSDPRYGQPRQLHQAVSGGRPPSMPPPTMPPPGADPNRPTGLRLLAGIFTKLRIILKTEALIKKTTIELRQHYSNTDSSTQMFFRYNFDTCNFFHYDV